MDQTPLNRFRSISKAVQSGLYSLLGDVTLTEDSNLEVIKMKVVPREGIHANKEYTLKLTFKEKGNWPKIDIQSVIYDRCLTSQYKKNIGFGGKEHAGICIKDITLNYPISKFYTLCENRWDVYISLVIATFNNIQDFEKGNGFKSNYKQILSI